MSAASRPCPQCGVPIPAGASEGLCPCCLLALNLGPQSHLAGDTPTNAGGPAGPPVALDEVAKLFPQLEILRLVGTGGMGAVYQARQPALDRHVALKLLHTPPANDPGFAGRFAQEARALAKLNHPNIVVLHEFGEVDGRPYFLMEFVDGVNLRELQRAERLSPREALQIVPAVCDALQYAHDEGIVHRDIKPENVLVDRKGRVKVADFGLAKLMGLETATTRLTGAGHVMGTPHYMAPEQVEHPLEVDHRADIFSLGVVFYELLTGELPLGKFPLPSKKVRIDVRLDDVVLRALEKEPALRYAQASELKTHVENIAGGPTSPERAPAPARSQNIDTPPKPASEVRAKSPRLSRAAVVALMLACVPFLILLVGPVVTGPVHAADRATMIWISVLWGIMLLAPVSTTILGWIAVVQIRRSPETVYGMGLGVVAGLLFPLLLLDGVMVALWVEMFRVMDWGTIDEAVRPWVGFIGLVSLGMMMVAVDVWIVRAVWARVVVERSIASVAAANPRKGRSKRTRWLAVTFAVCAIAVAIPVVKKHLDAQRERARTEFMTEVSHALSDALRAEEIQYDHISMAVGDRGGWMTRTTGSSTCKIAEPRRLRRVVGREDEWVPLKGEVIVERTNHGWTVRGTEDLDDIVITKTGATVLTGARAHGIDSNTSDTTR